jgi:hypothetical protein
MPVLRRASRAPLWMNMFMFDSNPDAVKDHEPLDNRGAMS